ncbi:MAG: nucleotidyltransferase domain-containing protein [Elusimicrobia bacterium]|nr:nucleotidyltransferase domain-containing protein [Candidatus Obscuribacterium magneticum]
MKEIQRELKRVARRLIRNYKPEKIILFGSLASGRTKAWSDIDLAIIKKSRRRFIDRLGDALIAANPKEAVDIFVYTPEEVATMEKQKNSFWIHEIIGRGKVLYQRG